MFSHSPTKLQMKIKGPPTVTKLTIHFISGLMSNLLTCKYKREHTLWSCMTQKSLLRSGVIQQYKTQTKTTSIFVSRVFLVKISVLISLFDNKILTLACEVC